MKIVINNCFGGFGLSLKAQLEYQKLKGKELFFYSQTKYKHKDEVEEWVKVEPNEKDIFISAITRDLGDVVVGELPYKEGEYFSEYNVDRTDPDLIKVVEMLGKEADGSCAELSVVEIPDGVKWQIEEYDGSEHIAENHRTWC